MPQNGLSASVHANARAVAILRRQVEDELRKSKETAENTEKLQRDFLANLSHEIRTPLNAIIGFSDMIQSGNFGPVANNKHAEYIELIQLSGRHLLSLIEDMIDMARIDSNTLKLDSERFQIASWAAGTIALAQPAAQQHNVGLSLAVTCPANATLCGDEARLRQVLANLIDNGIKFSEGGSVRVEVGIVGAVGADGAAQQLRCSVTDNGIGIPPEQQDRIFKRFGQVSDLYSRRHGGLGLGLVICKHIVDLMGGTIKMTSAPDRGTAVEFVVPTVPTTVPAP